MKRAKVLALVVGSFAMLGLSLSPVPALADSILDFRVVSSTGDKISYAGTINPLKGEGLKVDQVEGQDTPANNGVALDCFGCVLNFETGAHTSDWQWGSGGFITITGMVDLNNNNVADDPPLGDILTGTFVTGMVVECGGSSRCAFTPQSFTDIKDPLLTSFYGLGTGPYSGTFNLTFQSSAHSPSAFSSTAINGGNVLNAIPEPSSLLLLGSGLLSLSFWARKKFNGVN
jgi:PEP-CTERM motif-containing protein